MKNNLVGALLLALSGATLAVLDTSEICRNKKLGELLPHPHSCSDYIICNVKVSVQHCENGLHFDAKHKVCNWPQHANCQLENEDRQQPLVAIDTETRRIVNPMKDYDSENVLCRHFGLYFLPHPQSCRSYYLCAYGHMRQLRCGPDTMWNFQEQHCEISYKTECYAMTADEKIERVMLENECSTRSPVETTTDGQTTNTFHPTGSYHTATAAPTTVEMGSAQPSFTTADLPTKTTGNFHPTGTYYTATTEGLSYSTSTAFMYTPTADPSFTTADLPTKTTDTVSTTGSDYTTKTSETLADMSSTSTSPIYSPTTDPSFTIEDLPTKTTDTVSTTGSDYTTKTSETTADISTTSTSLMYSPTADPSFTIEDLPTKTTDTVSTTGSDYTTKTSETTADISTTSTSLMYSPTADPSFTIEDLPTKTTDTDSTTGSSDITTTSETSADMSSTSTSLMYSPTADPSFTIEDLPTKTTGTASTTGSSDITTASETTADTTTGDFYHPATVTPLTSNEASRKPHRPPTRKPTQAALTTMPSTTPDPSNPFSMQCHDKRQSYIAHPKDCSKYFMCISGMLIMTSCPKGLYWDARKIRCDLPKYVKCFN